VRKRCLRQTPRFWLLASLMKAVTSRVTSNSSGRGWLPNQRAGDGAPRSIPEGVDILLVGDGCLAELSKILYISCIIGEHSSTTRIYPALFASRLLALMWA
jgi:hypothetical protein